MWWNYLFITVRSSGRHFQIPQEREKWGFNMITAKHSKKSKLRTSSVIRHEVSPIFIEWRALCPLSFHVWLKTYWKKDFYQSEYKLWLQVGPSSLLVESGDRISLSRNRLKSSLNTGYHSPTGLDSCSHHVLIIQ